MNFYMDPEQRRCEDAELIHVVQDRILWQVPVISVMKIQVFLLVVVSLGAYRTAYRKV